MFSLESKTGIRAFPLDRGGQGQYGRHLRELRGEDG